MNLFTAVRETTAMDYQREQGRMTRYRNERLKEREFVLKMLPFIQQARSELFEPGERFPPQEAIANWLTGRVPTVGGGSKWHASQVGRVYQGPARWIDHVEKEYEIAFYVRKYVQENEGYPDREYILADLSDIEIVRQQEILAARKLEAKLRGEVYRERPVPPAPFYQEAKVTGVDRHTMGQFAKRQERLRQRAEALAQKQAELDRDKASLRKRIRELKLHADFKQPQDTARQRQEAKLARQEEEQRRRELNYALSRERLRFREAEVRLRERELRKQRAPFRERLVSSHTQDVSSDQISPKA